MRDEARWWLKAVFALPAACALGFVLKYPVMLQLGGPRFEEVKRSQQLGPFVRARFAAAGACPSWEEVDAEFRRLTGKELCEANEAEWDRPCVLYLVSQTVPADCDLVHRVGFDDRFHYFALRDEWFPEGSGKLRRAGFRPAVSAQSEH
ncbi:MAG: hypothetical protein H6718_19765 [Polyangiaceae bacterium]|nr:hypothetical protein [Myxococcales bacterium]MCB9587650.1 hypothetical protein [Polyangiaceae bacterium]MCB9605552.1 hypothetical protein [Polyangiaceae bacterium]